jgi:hypothetical protein
MGIVDSGTWAGGMLLLGEMERKAPRGNIRNSYALAREKEGSGEYYLLSVPRYNAYSFWHENLKNIYGEKIVSSLGVINPGQLT